MIDREVGQDNVHHSVGTARLSAELLEACLSPPHCNRVFTRSFAAERDAIEAAHAELPDAAAGLFRGRLRELSPRT